MGLAVVAVIITGLRSAKWRVLEPRDYARVEKGAERVCMLLDSAGEDR
jgi:hypothetical protein